MLQKRERQSEETASPKKMKKKKKTKQAAGKVIFQMATVKGAFVSLKEQQRKGQMERKTQRKSTPCTQWEGGIFWWAEKDVFWGKRAPSGGFWSAVLPEGLGEASVFFPIVSLFCERAAS